MALYNVEGRGRGTPPSDPKYHTGTDSAWSAAHGRSKGSLPGIASGSGSIGNSGSALDYVNSVSDYIDAFNVAQTNMVNEFNAKEAQKNRDWQERMSRNAHQYEVEDLIKAGLNPVLSAGGQGAFVGSGAVASGQKAVADDTRAMAALSLLNSSINSAGRIATQVASRGSVKQAEDAWKMTVTDGIKIAGIAASVIRSGTSALSSWLHYNKAMSYGLASGIVSQMRNKRR